MLPKLFRVAAGYEAVKGHVVFGAGVLLDIECDERVTIYMAGRRERGFRVGAYAYGDLAAHRPPRGLLVSEL
jgi:hypothetical protein